MSLRGEAVYISMGAPTDTNEDRELIIRIDNYDTWSMDRTLARIIIPMLKQLKATKHGIPSDMPFLNQTSNSGQASFAFYKEGDDLAFSAAEYEWDIVMDKMIYAFEHIVDDSWEQGFSSGVHDMIDVPEYDANGNILWYTSERGPNDTYTCDYEGIAEVQKRIQEGLGLFAKHYGSLWD